MADSILITGANRGIGLEMTRQAAAAGNYVTAACRTPDMADELNSLAANSGDKISVIGVEVRDEESVPRRRRQGGKSRPHSLQRRHIENPRRLER